MRIAIIDVATCRNSCRLLYANIAGPVRDFWHALVYHELSYISPTISRNCSRLLDHELIEPADSDDAQWRQRRDKTWSF